MKGIYTVRMTPTHRTLQATRATWDAVLLRMAATAPVGFRRTVPPSEQAIRAGLAASDGDVVRVTLDESDAREVLRLAGVSS